MKNQYFGDINDYRKYGLLRHLSMQGVITTAVCWMLTPDAADNADGQKKAYLEQPERFRPNDPELFDLLHRKVKVRGVRNVHTATVAKILPGAWFYPDIVPDDTQMRKAYFADFLYRAYGAELVFFDPDNGIEVASTPYGTRNSSKYLYWRELEETWRQGHSIIVYQHFPRIERTTFTSNIVLQMKDSTGIQGVYVFATPNVAFFLLLQQEHEKAISPQVVSLASAWSTQISLTIL